MKENYGTDHVKVIEWYNTMATSQAEMWKFGESKKTYNKALTIAKKKYSNNHPVFKKFTKSKHRIKKLYDNALKRKRKRKKY